MPIYKSSNSGIPFGDTASRPISPTTGQPYFNGQLQRLELYTGAQYGWQNIVAETPGVTGYTGTISEISGGTITVTGTNFASGANTTLVGSDGTEYIATSTTVNNLTSLTATFGPVSASLEPYDLRVTNPSNLYGVYYDILTVNDKPLWTTAAGSLGSFAQGSVSYQLVASDEENNPLTYALVSGSLPPGLSLSSSGLISGTNSGTFGTTYTFTASVSDGINTAQSRVFSMLISYPSVSGGTLTSDATYYYRTFTGNGNLSVSGTLSTISVDILLVAGGGGGGFQVGGGGGGGGYIQLSNYSLSSFSHSVQIGGGGTGGSASSRSLNGINTTMTTNSTTLTAVGGGGGANHSTTYNQNNNRGWDGGSGGGGSGDSSNVNELGGNSTQTTTNGGIAGSGFGNSGGQGRASNWAGGGGGGAGAAGQNSPSPDNGGTGGAGKQWVNGNYYAGGGGGCNNSSSSNVSGGIGGGGSGTGNGNNSSAKHGADNTGGGGGGVRDTSGDGGNGGSGIAIFRYTRAQVGG